MVVYSCMYRNEQEEEEKLRLIARLLYYGLLLLTTRAAPRPRVQQRRPDRGTVDGCPPDHFGAIRQDLLTSGAIEDAGLTSNDNWYTQNNSSGFSWEEKDPNTRPLISERYISPEYFSTLRMRVLEGRGFSGNIAADTPNVVITQSMERLMGKGSAIGKHIRYWRAEYQVVGVVNDYVYGDMYGHP